MVIYNYSIGKNFYYIPPDQFLKPGQEKSKTERVLKNIFDRVRAEEELKRSEEKFKAFFHNAAESMMIIGTAGDILEANNVAIKRYGYSREEFLKMKVNELDAPDIPTDLKENIKTTEEKGYSIFERVHLKKDGTKIPVEVSCSSVECEGQKVLLAIVRDIPDRKKAEEALCESEEKYRNLVERSNDGILIIQDGIVKFVYTRLAELWGGQAEELLKTPMIHHIHPDERDKVMTRYKRRRAGENVPPIYETVLLRKDDTAIHIEINAGVISYMGNSADLIMVRDITERKLAENVLKRDKLELERLVNNRSEKLLAAVAEVEKAKRLADIGTLAATVAHELRNSLAAIGMAAQNIKKRKADGLPFESYFTNIENTIVECDRIISDLLFYSRLKAPHLEIFNLYECLNDCVALAENSEKKKVSVMKNLAGLEGKSIQADPVQIKEMFANILNNAFDAVKDVGGKITVDCEWQEDGPVKIYFKDNGMGMDEKGLKNIFEPFYTTKAKGTGLGLTVCKQVADLHKGTMEISSKKNEGTTVTVTLPTKQI